MAKKIDWRICFIADSEAAAGRDMLTLVREAVEGGVTLVQLRGKKWTSREFSQIGLRAKDFLKRKQVPLLINDRLDVALACRADGVHLGQEDIPLLSARRILGQEKIIGISVNNIREAEAAAKEGADYLGVGPVFPTVSKDVKVPVLGLEGLRRIREIVRIPILAIGGIDASNVAEVMKAGADGIAVISAITSSEDARASALNLINSIEKVRKNR